MEEQPPPTSRKFKNFPQKTLPSTEIFLKIKFLAQEVRQKSDISAFFEKIVKR